MEHPIPLQRQIYQCVNNSSHAHSQSPLHAPYCALKGQTPSAVGTVLGINTHNINSPRRGKSILLISVAAVGANRIRPVLYSHGIFPMLRPGLSSLFPRDFVPGYHRCAQYCLPGRFPWCYLSPIALSQATIAAVLRLRPRLPSLCSVLPSRQVPLVLSITCGCVLGCQRYFPETASQATIATLSTAFQAGRNVG